MHRYLTFRPWTAFACTIVLLNPFALALAESAVPPATATSAASATPATPALPALPRDAFANRPEVSQLTLSPDGKRIAGLMTVDDTTLLFTKVVAANSATVAVLKTDNETFRFRWINWASNERLVASIYFASNRDFVQTSETRLLSVRHDGEGLINLVKSAPFARGRRMPQFQDEVIDWLPDDDQHILMQLPEEGSVNPGVYRVNLETGQRRSVHAPKRDVSQWITDAAHRVRVGIRQADGEREILVCDPDGENWRTLWEYDIADSDGVLPLGFGRDPNQLYVQANHEGRDAIFRVNLASPDLKRELVMSHSQFDIGSELIRSRATGDIVGVHSGVDAEEHADFWNESRQLLARAIDQALPGRSNHLLELSQDEQRYLVYSEGNGIPGEYYLGDRAAGKLELLARLHPQLPAARMAGKQQLELKARDGLALTAFLTQPSGSSGPLPLVLFPHGGPHARDDHNFDVLAEFLASRGYAVLQVNFRGSSGYGHEFASAGMKGWGLAMQDDLTDAVQWAIQQGVADPARVCAVGFSYGGYAALMGAVKTPELYRCIVSVNGVSDLPDLWLHQSQYVEGSALAERQFGEYWGDRDRLKATSPARNAERIRAPVLLIHGTQDRIVPIDQSETMSDALDDADKPHRYLEVEGADHSLTVNSHRRAVFAALEEFLGQHLSAPRVARQ